MLVTISKRPNSENVSREGEFVREYLSFERLAALDMIDDIIYQYVNLAGNLYPEEVEELNLLRDLQTGYYTINAGDYNYYITIEEEE